MNKIDLTQLIKERRIDTHEQLQRILYELSNGVYYWHYDYEQREQLIAVGMMSKVELVELNGTKLYYEVVKIT